MTYFISKLTSRKLWMAIAGVATGVYIAMGGEASDISSVAGAVTALTSIIAYIKVEGDIDIAALADVVVEAVEDIEDAYDTLTEE